MAFKFADLAAAQTGYVDVIARAVGFVVVAVAAQVVIGVARALGEG